MCANGGTGEDGVGVRLGLGTVAVTGVCGGIGVDVSVAGTAAVGGTGVEVSHEKSRAAKSKIRNERRTI